MRRSFGNPSINPSPLNDAYEKGIEAAHSGKSAADCPCKYESEEGQQWMQGYQDGGGTD